MTEKLTREMIDHRISLIVRISPWMVQALLTPTQKIFPAESCPFPLMATDGTSVLYHEINAVEKMDNTFFCFGYIHEIAHILSGHVFMKRQEWYNNINVPVMDYACENVANYFCKAFGYIVPKGLVYDEEWDGMTEWDIYHKIMADPQKKKEVEKMMQGKGASTGEGLPEHQQWGKGMKGEHEESAQRGRAAAVLADVANKAEQMNAQGTNSAYLKRRVGVLTDTTDWVHHLTKYLTYSRRPDFTYAQPDRRRMRMMGGVIFPSVYENPYERSRLEKAAIFIDSSGSMSDQTMARNRGTFKKIIEDVGGYDCIAGYCDCEVHNVGPLEDWEKIDVVGNGGTDFRPIFEYVDKELDNDIKVLIISTDGMGDFPDQEPPYDVIWLDYGPGVHYPFGQVIQYTI